MSIRQTFPHSGVYLASTLKSVWQIGWYAQEGDLLWSDDLRSLARLDRNAVRTGGGLAFYRDGVLVKKHEWKDLLTGLKSREFIPFTTGDWHWKWYKDFKLNPAHDQVIFSTARRHYYIDGIKDIDLGLQEFYTFDLSSGAIVSQRSVGAWRIWAYGLAGLAAIVTLGFISRDVLKRIKVLENGRGFSVAPHRVALQADRAADTSRKH